MGEKLAERIHDELGVDSLEELEIAAHDGRLAEAEGGGEEKLQGIRDALAGILSRPVQRRAQKQAEGGHTQDEQDEREEQPSVDTLLEADREYREKV